MKKLSVLLLATVLLAAIPAVVQAANGGGVNSTTAPGTATSYSTITVTIPSVVAIDVETDVTFSLGSYVGSGSGCSNLFPPSISCSSATFAPTSASTTAGVSPSPTGNDIAVAAFDNKSGATVTVGAKVAAAWSPAGGPGFATTMIANKVSTANQTSTPTGFAAFTNLTTAGATFTGNGLTTLPFGWTRIDQSVELNITTLPAIYNAGTFTTTVSFYITST